MAVYTKVSEEELRSLLLSYDIGTLTGLEGIAQGVSNTNYHLFTDRGRYILTLFEPHRVHADDLPYFIDYPVVLSRAGVPVPETMRRNDGGYLSILSQRPAAIYSFLEGEGGHGGMMTPEICKKAGAVLARMHLAGAGIEKTAINHFGLPRWKDWVRDIGAKMNDIDAGLYDLTREELDYIVAAFPSGLPSGAIHADYFPDNVFFKGGDVVGVIDFHFVCRDLFVYDLAIAINAWCFDVNNDFSAARMDAMMRGYESVRGLSGAEHEALPLLLRAAALRFLLSRIEEKLAWTPQTLMIPHDPMVFEKRLRHFQKGL